MKVSDTGFEGLKLIELPRYEDNRGYFTERFNLAKFGEHNLPTHFFQDNLSFSYPEVLRGMHYQTNPAQGKLVGALSGKILDVVIDLRSKSFTYGKHYSVELSSDNNLLLWVPEGFAHGFCVLGPSPAVVMYKASSPYNPQSEGGILWNDPDLAIKWPVTNPVLSQKDEKLSSFKQYTKNPLF